MRIQIVGAGCPACRNLEKDVRARLVQQQVEAQVERVEWECHGTTATD